MSTPGVDHPEERSVVDVKAVSRDDVLVSFVERVSAGELVLSVGTDAEQRRVRLEPGEHLELIWRGPEELRSVPAELVAVDKGDDPTWRVRTIGPASRGQRRAAVRAPLAVPLELKVGQAVLPGATLDLSEGGTRCLLAGDSGKQPDIEAGKVVPVTLDLDGNRLAVDAEVVRRHAREDERTELSLRFVGLGERREDVIRRRVFAELRDLRSRGVI
ncbi:flagellar brake protein [Geodermatophilus maliterrae]|uniref:Flagellar brake protein n=1 Tax=Geodermatophilus maliterrae TaxID=3162531 RepID=A0ABV3XFT1_9ACTN